MENNLIKIWKEHAYKICKIYEQLGEDFKEQLKNLASEQLIRIEETKPDKTKTIEEQCNKEQLELLKYLNKIAETGELE